MKQMEAEAARWQEPLKFLKMGARWTSYASERTRGLVDRSLAIRTLLNVHYQNWKGDEEIVPVLDALTGMGNTYFAISYIDSLGGRDLTSFDSTFVSLIKNAATIRLDFEFGELSEDAVHSVDSVAIGAMDRALGKEFEIDFHQGRYGRFVSYVDLLKLRWKRPLFIVFDNVPEACMHLTRDSSQIAFYTVISRLVEPLLKMEDVFVLVAGGGFGTLNSESKRIYLSPLSRDGLGTIVDPGDLDALYLESNGIPKCAFGGNEALLPVERMQVVIRRNPDIVRRMLIDGYVDLTQREGIVQSLLGIYGDAKKSSRVELPPLSRRMIEYTLFDPVELCQVLVEADPTKIDSGHPLIVKLLAKALVMPGVIGAVAPEGSWLASVRLNLPSRHAIFPAKLQDGLTKTPAMIVPRGVWTDSSFLFLSTSLVGDRTKKVLIAIAIRPSLNQLPEVESIIGTWGTFHKIVVLIVVTQSSEGETGVIHALTNAQREVCVVFLDNAQRRRDFLSKVYPDSSLLANIETLIQREESRKKQRT